MLQASDIEMNISYGMVLIFLFVSEGMTAMQGNALNMKSATAVLSENGTNTNIDITSKLFSRAFHHRSM